MDRIELICVDRRCVLPDLGRERTSGASPTAKHCASSHERDSAVHPKQESILLLRRRDRPLTVRSIEKDSGWPLLCGQAVDPPVDPEDELGARATDIDAQHILFRNRQCTLLRCLHLPSAVRARTPLPLDLRVCSTLPFHGTPSGRSGRASNLVQIERVER